jgi:hypothetical protein
MEKERERMRKETADELREREIRKKNVVMHRVGEAGPEMKTIEERKAWDMKSCDNIFNALEMDFRSEDAVRFVRRVGEKGDGPRPLIVGFKREWQREDILDRARHLKTTRFPEVVIVPDLTKEQRREEAAMNEEAGNRNKELTEDDKAKNLEWMVVGARGEKRIVKGVVRQRGGATRGSLRGTPAASTHGAPPLLPPASGKGLGNQQRGAGVRQREADLV